jgi:DNA topoisomerase VI subunit A
MSYIKFEEPKNVSEVINKLKNTIEVYKKQLKIINILFEALKQFEGKAITKRIITVLQKSEALKDYHVSLDTSFGMYHINIFSSKENISFGTSFRALIAYHGSENIVNIEKIKEYNQCYTLNEGRIKNLEENMNKVESLVNRWNKAFLAMKQVNKEAENIEGLEYILDFPRK